MNAFIGWKGTNRGTKNTRANDSGKDGREEETTHQAVTPLLSEPSDTPSSSVAPLDKVV